MKTLTADSRRYLLALPRYLSPLIAIVLALLVGGCVLQFSGYNALSVYAALFSSAFYDSFGISEMLVRATPIILCALSVAICLHASLWNIGAEGQILLGCLGSTWIALSCASLPSCVLLPLMFLGGFLGGALWAGVAGILRSRFAVSEILTTLLMNYVAIELVNYFVYGPWRDSAGSNFPNTPLFTPNAWLGSLHWGRLHTGCFVALAMTTLVYVLLKYTTFGFEVRVVGDNVKAARYAGMSVAKVIFLTMVLAGGMAGLAGFVEVAGVEHKMHHRMPKGFGYMAIIIAWLARKHPFWIIPVALLMSGLAIGSEMVQISHDIPKATVNVLEGIILLFVLVSDVVQEKFSHWLNKTIQ